MKEECGVFGIASPEKREIGRMVYYGLFALQHRGQEAAGIAVNEDREIRCRKGTGLVHEVFGEAELSGLGQGRMAVGHVRYGTTGERSPENAQPMLVRHVKGQLALCHNGNLVNSLPLRRALELEGCIFHTTSDTEVISYIVTRKRLSCPSIEAAVSEAMTVLRGAYSLVMMSPSKLIACRDPYGFRPLCYGITKDGCHVVASETCALDSVNAEYVRDIAPGEILVMEMDRDGSISVRSMRVHVGQVRPALCIFEYIDFSRADSVLEGVSVHEARKRAGALLAEHCPAEADIVIGVPDSGLDAALGYAEASGIPYGVGFVRNRYIGRTFIAPGQTDREQLVRLKLNPVSSVIKGQRVVMIDDSIVRGTTSQRIAALLKGAGAAEIHLRISSPPFLHPCYYGTDVDSEENLIAASRTVQEMAVMLGVDSLGFLPPEEAHLLAAGRPAGSLCDACFTGRYPEL